VPNKAELLGLEKIIASNKTLFAINKLNIKWVKEHCLCEIWTDVCITFSIQIGGQALLDFI
jgi:hypothetical protein